MRRRTVLAGVPVALATAGCTDFLTDEEVTFEAETAFVTDAAQDDTGYSEVGIQEDEITREFEDVDRTVVVTNKLAEYSRSIQLPFLDGELARFTVLATPKIDIVPGRVENPVGDMSDEELAETLQQEYDEIDDVELDEERSGELLGETVDVSRFDAQAQTQGEGVDVFIHIAQGESGDDFVVTLAVHPQDIDEQERVDRLIEGVDHPM